jgi:hypothetical protein
MARRIVNRRELRKQTDEAERSDPALTGGSEAAAAKKPKDKAAATSARIRKTRAKKAPPRMRARWGVFDGSMKQVAIFDYNQRAAADEKLADLREKKKGLHFMQIVKEPMPEALAAEGGK